MQGGLEWGGLVPRPGIEPGPLHWEHRVLATGPPGKSPKYCVYGSLKKKIKENNYNSATCKIWPKHTVGPQTCQDFTERWQVKLYVGQRGESQARSHALSSPASPRRVPGGSKCPSPDTWARTSWNCSLVRGSRKVVRTLRSALLVTVMLLAVSSRWKALFNSSPFSVIFWNKIRLTSKDDSIGFATVVAVRERERAIYWARLRLRWWKLFQCVLGPSGLLKQCFFYHIQVYKQMTRNGKSAVIVFTAEIYTSINIDNSSNIRKKEKGKDSSLERTYVTGYWS